MSNILTFVRPHKSITSLEPIDLPKFAVLTGINGSGKTHLLNSIKMGHVTSSLTTNPELEIRIFDSTNIIPADTGIFDPAQDQTRRSQWFQVIQTYRNQLYPNVQNALIAIGIPATLCNTPEKLSRLDMETLVDIFGSSEHAKGIHDQIQAHVRNAGQGIAQSSYQNIGDDFWRKNAPRVAETSPESFLFSSHADFFRNNSLLWGGIDPFQQAFGQIFATYRSLIHENDRFEKYGSTNAHGKFLSDQEFSKEYGPPPWEFVNQILTQSNLDFRVDSPPLSDISPYEPKLTKLSKDVEMKFEDLSSGEKVLMSFALCLYNSRENRQFKTFPRLLLLDEVDAPLHPSMAASLLNTIKRVLVDDKNVAVILTTHSPSTVALAPEESIYAMDPTGPRVNKISKGTALSLLTAGVPTLSISFTGRRQVFVESRTDASLYDLLYQKYKGALNSERSLNFVEVGKTNEKGLEQAGGCDQVERLVQSLAAAGNESVFGLVDWDGRQTVRGRIHVLAPTIRDGLESLLFDPLLVFALIARENLQFLRDNSLIESEANYPSLASWGQDRWQTAVDGIQSLILKRSINTNDSTHSINYKSGLSLKIQVEYLHLDDHGLESRIMENFPFLKAKNKRAGELMHHVVNTVLSDFEDFLPDELLNTLSGVLEADSDVK